VEPVSMVSVVPHRWPALTGRKTGLAAPRRSGDRGVQRRAPVRRLRSVYL